MMNDYGVNLLCAGIVKQAISDYINALNNDCMKSGGYSAEQLEKWFKSQEFQALCSLDGDYIIKYCRKEAGQWQKKRALNVGSGGFLWDKGPM